MSALYCTVEVPGAHPVWSLLLLVQLSRVYLEPGMYAHKPKGVSVVLNAIYVPCWQSCYG